ncbi:MAG: hypothetical protein K2Q32_09900 [Alphaproteobacteria bacterium]|nr:hypothetical protein [Alphaproteobacteria bacterium]
MTQGFPPHIRLFSNHAARHINIVDVANRTRGPFSYLATDDGGFIYHTPRGGTIRIPDFPKDVSVIEAYHEILAAAWGNILQCPIAPVVYNMDGEQPVISSICAFQNPITKKIIFKKSIRQDTLRAGKRATPINEWVKLIDNAGKNLPLQDMEQFLFMKTAGAISHSIPLVNWLGGWDPDTGNMLVDRDELLAQLNGTSAKAHVGLYLCDFTDSQLRSGFNDGQAPTVDTPLNRSALSGLAEFVRAYPSIFEHERRLLKHSSEDKDDEFDPAALINPLFAPYLDFAGLRETARMIKSFDNGLIHTECLRLADGMAQIMDNDADLNTLYAYAAYKAEVLILRRDLLEQHMAPLLAFADAAKPDGNPFHLFTKAVDAEIIKTTQAAKAAKAAARPKTVRAKSKKKDGDEPNT